MSNELIPIPENTALAIGERDERGLTAYDNKALNAVVSRHNLIQAVIKEVFKQDMHYGKIPGCGDKVVLLQPGAEMLLMLFKISSKLVVQKFEEVKDGLPIIAYKVIRECYNQDGAFIGSGVGYCSSEENKYKWRKSYKSEFDSVEHPAHKRLKKGIGKDGKEYATYSIVNDNPADLENTILKMADKRALVSATKSVTGASAFFTQDLEDMDSDYIWNQESEKPDIKEPQATKQPEQTGQQDKIGEKISGKEASEIYKMAYGKGWTKEAIDKTLDGYGYKRCGDITREHHEVILKIFSEAPVTA